MHHYLIPTYNDGRYVHAALASIRAQYPSQALYLHHARILALDDGSTDGTAAILDRLAARVPNLHVRHNARNLGIARTRNELLDRLYAAPMARDDFVLFVDGDDVLSPGHLANKLALFARHPALDAIGGQVELFYEDGTPAHVVDTFPTDPDILAISNLFECHLYGSNTLFRARVFRDRHARFPEVAASEDWLFFVDRRLRACNAPQVTLRYRRHAGNVTARPLTPLRSRLRAMARRLGALRLGLFLSRDDCDLLDAIGYLSFRLRWEGGRAVPAACRMPWFRYLGERPDAARLWPQLRPRLDGLFGRMLAHNRGARAYPQAKFAAYLQALQNSVQAELGAAHGRQAAPDRTRLVA